MRETKKESTSEFRVVVEVDGNPVGYLSMDFDRLWPLINHHRRDVAAIEWLDRKRFESVMRMAVLKRFMKALESRLYQALGDEMVKAELDVENLTLRVEAAGQAFGRMEGELEQLVAESGRSVADFHNFFWEYLLDEKDVVDLKKEWKAARKP